METGDTRSPLLQILDAIAESERQELLRRFGPPKTLLDILNEVGEAPKPKRRRVDFHGLTVIDGGKK